MRGEKFFFLPSCSQYLSLKVDGVSTGILCSSVKSCSLKNSSFKAFAFGISITASNFACENCKLLSCAGSGLEQKKLEKKEEEETHEIQEQNEAEGNHGNTVKRPLIEISKTVFEGGGNAVTSLGQAIFRCKDLTIRGCQGNGVEGEKKSKKIKSQILKSPKIFLFEVHTDAEIFLKDVVIQEVGGDGVVIHTDAKGFFFFWFCGNFFIFASSGVFDSVNVSSKIALRAKFDGQLKFENANTVLSKKVIVEHSNDLEKRMKPFEVLNQKISVDGVFLEAPLRERDFDTFEAFVAKVIQESKVSHFLVFHASDCLLKKNKMCTKAILGNTFVTQVNSPLSWFGQFCFASFFFSLFFKIRYGILVLFLTKASFPASVPLWNLWIYRRERNGHLY